MLNNYWNPSVADSGNVALNWTLGEVPHSGHLAIWDNTSSGNCTLYADIIADGFQVNGYSGVLNLNGYAMSGLTDTAFLFNIGTGGTINLSSSTIVCSGNLYWNGATGTITRGTSTLIMEGANKILRTPVNSTPLRSWYNVQFSDNSSNIAVSGGTVYAYGLATINRPISLLSDFYCINGLTQAANGTITGNSLYLWGGTNTLANTVDITPSNIVVKYSVDNFNSGTYAPLSLLQIRGASASGVFAWSSGDYVFNSPVNIRADGVDLIVSGNNNPTLKFNSDLTVDQLNNGCVIFSGNSINSNQLIGTNYQTINLCNKDMGNWILNKPIGGTVAISSGSLVAGGDWSSADLVTLPASTSFNANGYAMNLSSGLNASCLTLNWGSGTWTLGGSVIYSGVTTNTQSTASIILDKDRNQIWASKTGSLVGGSISVNKTGGNLVQLSNISADAFTLTSGTLLPSGYNLTVTKNLIIGSEGQILDATLGGSTWTVGGSFSGLHNSNSWLGLNPSSAWTLNVTGNSVVKYANVANSNSTGSVSSGIVSWDKGSNTNWLFSNYTYYVDPSGSDSNTGLSDSTAWASMAKVGSGIYAPGDIIKFKRGCTWREMLNASSSGIQSSPITYAHYGSGINPILNGSVVISTTGFLPITPFTFIYNGGIPTTNQNDGVIRNYREVISGIEILATATGVMLTLQASDDKGDWNISGVSIGQQVISGDALSLTRVTFSGLNTVLIPSGQVRTSDAVGFLMTPGSTNYLVHVYMGARYLRGSSNKHIVYYNSVGTDGTMTLTGPTSVASIGMVRRIDSVDATVTIYSGNYPTNPIVMWESGVYMPSGSSLDACQATGVWYFAGSGALMIHSWDNSNVATNQKVYEGWQQTENIRDNGRPYNIFDGIDCIRTGSSDVYLGGIKFTGSGCIARNANLHQHRRHGLTFYTGAVGCSGYNNTIYDSYSTTPVAFYDSTTNNNVLCNNTIYQSQNFSTVTDCVCIHEYAFKNEIRENEIYRRIAGNGRLVHTYGGAFNNKIYRNKFRGSSDYGVQLSNGYDNAVYCNLFEGTLNTPIYCAGHSGAIIVDNTVYEPSGDGYAIRLTGGSPNAIIKNNIVHHGAYYVNVSADSESGIDCNYNDYWGGNANPFVWGPNTYTWAQWKASGLQDSSSLVSDPLFASSGVNYGVRYSSWCRTSGVNLGSPYELAMFPSSSWTSGISTRTRVFPWEMGAFSSFAPVSYTISTDVVTKLRVDRNVRQGSIVLNADEFGNSSSLTPETIPPDNVGTFSEYVSGVVATLLDRFDHRDYYKTV